MSNTVPPSHGQPEYLEQGGGTPLPPDEQQPRNLKRPLLVGGAALGLAALGGGVWAAMSFFATGAQPAEALPASTLAYASIDLDPSGGQKIEAIEMMREFPAFREEIGLDLKDDIKARIFEEGGFEKSCPAMTYAEDLEPWLGDRAAVAAVDLGEPKPTTVVVVQVTDADAAGDGLAKLRGCEGDDEGGWTINGEWAVLAETQAIGREVAADAEQGTLADDATYRKWTGETGEAGVMTLYAAPVLGDVLASELGDFMGVFGPMGGGFEEQVAGEPGESPELPPDVKESLEDFGGMAATLRFDDGALELEAAGDSNMVRQNYYATDRGGDALSTLPADTAAAIGVGFEEGWAQHLIDYLGGIFGGGDSIEEMVTEAERASGLSLPEDLETLFGRSTTVAIGSDLDPESFFNSSDGSDVPVGVKVQGDPEAIEAVLDKLRGKLAEGGDEGLLGSDAEGDLVVFGPNADYLGEIVGDGGLGDSVAFRTVVREADRAGAIIYVNFDAGSGWALDEQEVDENIEPLEGFGVSVWQDGDIAHGVLRLTTNN